MPYRRQFYIPALDGLRALALIAVFAYHVDEVRVPGGFLGVDLFFVISGYVITLGLLDEWRSRGSIDLRHFWWRRARRLMPAAGTLILAVLAITAVWYPERMASLRGEAVAAMAYVANWYLVFHRVPYFESVAAPSLLRHLWSLAVEEQFYLLWPPLLAAALRLFSVRWVFVVTVALAVGSALLLATLYAADAPADRLYYGTDTRGFALLGGAALAFVCRPRAVTGVAGRLDVAAGIIGTMSLVGLCVLCWTLNGSYAFVYQGGLVVTAVASLGAVLMCARADNAYTRALGSRPMRWLGTRSYSAYLWHWPVVLLLPVHGWLQAGAVEGAAMILVAVVCTLVAAEASYRWIEMPLREGRLPAWAVALREVRGARRGVVLAGGLVSALAVMSLTVTVARARVPEPPSYLAVPRLQALISVDDGRAMEDVALNAIRSDAAPSLLDSQNTMPASVVGPLAPGTRFDGSVLDPSSASESPRPVPTVASTVAPGDFVTAVGDSVMLGGATALARVLGVVDLDAEAGRSASAVFDVLRDRVSTGRIGSVVVLQIGDNGALRAERLDDALTLLGPSRRVVVVNLRVPRAWEGPNNAVLADVVRRHSNSVLVDWHAASEGHPEYLYDDQIHLNPEGAAAYASLIAAAIRR